MLRPGTGLDWHSANSWGLGEEKELAIWWGRGGV